MGETDGVGKCCNQKTRKGIKKDAAKKGRGLKKPDLSKKYQAGDCDGVRRCRSHIPFATYPYTAGTRSLDNRSRGMVGVDTP